MIRFVKKAGVLVASAAMALALWAPAQAAKGADLEARIKAMETQLQALRTELRQQKAVQEELRRVQPVAARMAARDALPSWVKRMRFYGDVRFRFENTSYDSDKPDRERFRVRLRFGVKSQIHPDVQLGFRVVSGADTEPTSTNQTFSSWFQEHSNWGFDRVWVKWTPSFTGKMATLLFGKVANPFVTTRVMWDGDVNPEGGFLKLNFNRGGNIQPFVLVGVMFLNEHSSDIDDVYAYAGQVGVKGKFGGAKVLIAAAYYNWGDTGQVGNLPTNLHGNPPIAYDSTGNPTQISEFSVVDLVARVSFKLSKKMKLGFWGHYLTNQDAEGVWKDKDTGYAGGGSLSYGKVKFSVWYKHIEANATPGFIADSDSGYVNREGFVIGVVYQMWKYGQFKITYFDTEAIDKDIAGASDASQTLFVETVFKF